MWGTLFRRRALTALDHAAFIGDDSDRLRLFVGVSIGARAMIVGGFVEVILGVPAERRSLEDIAAPLSVPHGNGVDLADSRGCVDAPKKRPSPTAIGTA